jgi:hypothetical protein
MDGRERRSKPYYGVACRDPSEPSIGSMIITSGIATIAIGAKTTAIVIGMTTTMIATTTTIVTTPTGDGVSVRFAVTNSEAPLSCD